MFYNATRYIFKAQGCLVTSLAERELILKIDTGERNVMQAVRILEGQPFWASVKDEEPFVNLVVYDMFKNSLEGERYNVEIPKEEFQKMFKVYKAKHIMYNN